MELSRHVQQVLEDYHTTMPRITFGTTWESLDYQDKTIEKIPKEAFEAKLQELIDAQPLKELRQERDRRLQAVDWVAVKAFTTSTPVPEAWATYMQALRDLPATTEDPKNPVWPTAPTS